MKTPWDRCSGEGWTADPRPVPAELETDYPAAEFTEAEQAAAAVILELGEGQQTELWAALDHRVFTCPHCTSEYTSAYAAIVCEDQCLEDGRQLRRDGRGSD